MLNIALSNFPRKVLHRQQLHNSLDIVVSLGGIFSLFIGCNLINIIELVFIHVKQLICKAKEKGFSQN